MTRPITPAPGTPSPFEAAKHMGKSGAEFWFARDLAGILEYSEFRHFMPVIDKAMIACKASNHKASDHFEEYLEMVPLGSGAKRGIRDFKLSRYACYLIIQNGDSSKPVVAHGQTYFAIQTRRQELADDKAFAGLSEDGKRLALRKELAGHNISLADAARKAGIEGDRDYAVFQNHGYKGLYGGLNAQGIHTRKKLKKSHKILDHMGSTELAANLFRATQTQEKLRRDEVSGKPAANRAHFEVGAKVRKTIKELGGTMPEDLPAPDKSLAKIAAEQRRLISDKADASKQGVSDKKPSAGR